MGRPRTREGPHHGSPIRTSPRRRPHRARRHGHDRALRPGHRRPCHRGPGARRGPGRHRDHRHGRVRRRRPGGRQVREGRGPPRRPRRRQPLLDLAPSPTSSPSAPSTPASSSSPRSSAAWATPRALVIPDDKMAVSVELTDFERVAGFVNPGNEVAIFATALDPVAPPARRQGAEARQPHPHRPHPRAGPRRRHDERHLAHDRRARTASRRPRRSPRTILTLAVDPGRGREAHPRRPHRRSSTSRS